MQKLGKIVVVAAAVLSVAACGQKTADTAQPGNAAGPSTPHSSSAPATQSKGRECTADDVKTTGKFGEAPTITIPEDCDPPKKLITKDLSEGTGEGAKAGQKLEMNYHLVTWSDKQVLDSSFGKKTFPLTLGGGEVIQGWDQGLAGIKQGARRLLIIPPDLGYGQGGQGIKPNETLVFVTDAVSIAAA